MLTFMLSFTSLIHHCSALLGVTPNMKHIGSSSVNTEGSWDGIVTGGTLRGWNLLFWVTDTSTT